MITYNQERYIRQAIEGILFQNIDVEIEILVGNDASNDRTGDILNELNQTDRLHLIQRKKNIGASANLFNLLGLARGKYIALLEGDDYWTDCDKLQKQYDFLKEHTEFIGCTHECLLVDEQGEALPDQSLEWISKNRIFDMREHQGLYLAGQTGTLMFHNIFKDDLRDYEIIKTAHSMISDRTLQMVLALNGRLYRLEECMGAYRQINRQGEDNATSQCFAGNIHSVYDNFVMTCRLEEFANKFNQIPETDFSLTKKMFFVSAVYQWIRKRSPEIYQDIKKILHFPGVSKWGYIFFIPKGIFLKLKNSI